MSLGPEEVPGHRFGGVEAPELSDDRRSVLIHPRDVLGIGSFRLILIAEAAAGRVDANRKFLAHAPAQHIDEMDAVVAKLAIAKIPEPVPVVVDEILMIRLHRGGSDPEVPVEPGRWFHWRLETDRVPVAGKEEVGLINVPDI